MRTRRPSEAGTTLIELMVALAILLIVVAGFWSTVFQAVNATGIGHCRTVGTWLRAELVDRLTLSPRVSITPATADEWMIDQCFDGGGRPTAANAAMLVDFACSDSDQYQRWVRVVPETQRVNTYGFAGPIWKISVYVENRGNPCTPDTWKQSMSCVGAEYYLTD